jgi:hypothetical protein
LIYLVEPVKDLPSCVCAGRDYLLKILDWFVHAQIPKNPDPD